MDALSYPWRKIGVVSRSTRAEDSITESASPMPSFLEACEQCHEDVIRYLLRKGITKAELNARDKTGKVRINFDISPILQIEQFLTNFLDRPQSRLL